MKYLLIGTEVSFYIMKSDTCGPFISDSSQLLFTPEGDVRDQNGTLAREWFYHSNNLPLYGKLSIDWDSYWSHVTLSYETPDSGSFEWTDRSFSIPCPEANFSGTFEVRPAP